jgi:hypothetical protein
MENNNTENIVIPENIINDVSNTGYIIDKIHKHGKYYILTLSFSINMNWDPKDFSRFKWVVANSEYNNNLKKFKLRITF